MAVDFSEVSMKISNGVTLTNVKTQAWTVVTGLAAFSPISPPPSPPPAKTWKHETFTASILLCLLGLKERLLEKQWFPASFDGPKIVVSFVYHTEKLFNYLNHYATMNTAEPPASYFKMQFKYMQSTTR